MERTHRQEEPSKHKHTVRHKYKNTICCLTFGPFSTGEEDFLGKLEAAALVTEGTVEGPMSELLCTPEPRLEGVRAGLVKAWGAELSFLGGTDERAVFCTGPRAEIPAPLDWDALSGEEARWRLHGTSGPGSVRTPTRHGPLPLNTHHWTTLRERQKLTGKQQGGRKTDGGPTSRTSHTNSIPQPGVLVCQIAVELLQLKHLLHQKAILVLDFLHSAPLLRSGDLLWQTGTPAASPPSKSPGRGVGD